MCLIKKTTQQKGYKRWAKVIVPMDTVTGTAGVVISTETGAHSYWLSKCPSNLGDGFILRRECSPAGQTNYIVELSDAASQCNCPAFFHGAGDCKHILALKALRNNGSL